MLTFEKVLEVFGDYLQQDPLYECHHHQPRLYADGLGTEKERLVQGQIYGNPGNFDG